MAETFYAPGSPSGPPSPPLSGGGDDGDGSGTQQVFNNRDPAEPDDPTLPAASFNTTTGVTTWWNVAGQVWN